MEPRVRSSKTRCGAPWVAHVSSSRSLSPSTVGLTATTMGPSGGWRAPARGVGRFRARAGWPA
eukprot:9214846-Lingulodinium_polyedra.AAC.1